MSGATHSLQHFFELFDFAGQSDMQNLYFQAAMVLPSNPLYYRGHGFSIHEFFTLTIVQEVRKMLKKTIGFVLFGLLVLLGCKQETEEIATGPQIEHAIVVLHATEGNTVSGVVEFRRTEGGVQVTGEINGLSPGGEHGFHVHQYGDCSGSDGKTAGGHFNPEGMEHGGPTSEKRHIGDLGNITANEAGIAKIDFVDKKLSLTGPHSIIGRGVIVHAKADDLTSQPTGAAGARLACGVIGIAK